MKALIIASILTFVAVLFGADVVMAKSYFYKDAGSGRFTFKKNYYKYPSRVYRSPRLRR